MAKGMDAVLERTKEAGSGKKKAVLAKKVAEKLAQGPGKKGPKGPGMAVMIAIGAPKKGASSGMDKTEEAPMRDGFQDQANTSTKAILAKMDARIAKLEEALKGMSGMEEEEGHDAEEMDGEEDGEEED